jgi:DNA polymerase-3 subunit beta
MSLHVTIAVGPFRAAFSKAAKIVPSRSPRPILQNVKLVADTATTLSSTDLEVGLVLSVPGVTVLHPGSAILPTAKIASILGACKDDTLDVQVDGDHLLINGRQAKFKFPTESPDLFPTVPTFDAVAYHAVTAGDLRKAIRRTVFATDESSTRYALSGCLFELTPTTLTLVGTDGRRLAKMSTPAEAVHDAVAPGGSPVVPVKALKAIDGMLDDGEAVVHVAFVGGARFADGTTGGASAVLVRVGDGGAVVYSRLVEGRFPSYAAVIPDSSDFKIPMDVDLLRGAVEQASIVTSDESRGVRFTWAGGMLTLSSQAADVGSSEVTMPVEHDGPEVFSVYDPRYLIDALKVMDDGSMVVANLVDQKNAGLYTTDDGYSYVVMPLSTDR